MMPDWVSTARTLVAAVGDFTMVVPRERWLNDRLLEFTFEPDDQLAATMILVASPDQLMFFAGRGTRFELDASERAAGEAKDLARAVAAGGLTETVGRHRVRFVVDFGDGNQASGSSTIRGDQRDVERGTYRYAPYPDGTLGQT